MVVDFIQGNPVSLWWTEKSLQRFFDEQFPEERYVVAPGSYGFWDGTNRYVCPVYQTGEEDVVFSAYLSGGQVYTNRALTVDSGLNTSNRLRNELAGLLDTNRLCRDLKGRSPYETTLTFYPENNDQVFDPQSPLFRVGMEFSADDLPLPTVLYTGFHSADREPPEVTLEEAATYLVALKQAAANQGLAYDYYSATIYGRNITWLLLDVPSEVIPDQLPEENTAAEKPGSETAAESTTPEPGSFDALVALLQDRITQNGQTSPTVADASPATEARSLSDQRVALLYSEDSCFQPL